MDPSGPAARAGLEVGDLVVAIDGKRLRDIIDYQYFLEPGTSRLTVERHGRSLSLDLELKVGQDAGIVFNRAVFDRLRTCACKCIFCFVKQLPHGLRAPLYLKDDDYRLSFLNGNFITLNNMAEDDIDRIILQGLGPLHVSVHSTNPQIRASLMGIGREPASAGLANLRRLGEAGIETHAQIVLCPGFNDKDDLRRSIRDLAERVPGVASVGVVPLAIEPAFLKKHSSRGLRAVSGEDCRDVIDSVAVLQERYRLQQGRRFVYAADEFYLQAAADLPPISHYDDFPQYENGIGIAVSFLAAAAEKGKAEAMLAAAASGCMAGGKPLTGGKPLAGGTVHLLTGLLAAGVVGAACALFNRSGDMVFESLIVENQLFGPHVTVTGLLGGKDIIRAARAVDLNDGDLLLVPPACINNSPDQLFLDGVSLAELNAGLDCTVSVVQL